MKPDRGATPLVARWVLCVAHVVACASIGTAARAQEAGAAPEAAHGELHVQALRPGLSVVYGAGGNVVVWSGPDGVLLVDTGLAARSAELYETIARTTPGTLRFVVNTHGHADHTGGNEIAARRGAVLIGQEGLRERAGRDAAVPSGLAESAAMPVAARPTITTGTSLTVYLNGDRLDVLHVADAHTSADLVMRWAQADVVALGDIYWSGQYPYIDVADGGSLAGIVAAVEAALARANPRTLIVPGHGPVSSRVELAAYRDMLVAVGRSVRLAVERGEGLEQVQAARPTAAFDARYARDGAYVSPQDFVRNVYADLTRGR